MHHANIRFIQGTGLGGLFHADMHMLTYDRLLPNLRRLVGTDNLIVDPWRLAVERGHFGLPAFVDFRFPWVGNLHSIQITYDGAPSDQRRLRQVLTFCISHELRRSADGRYWTGRNVETEIRGRCDRRSPLVLLTHYSAPVPSP
jgi:hypothetical protein